MAYFEFKYYPSGELYPIHADMYANAESENPVRIGQVDEPRCAVYRANLALPGANSKNFKTQDQAVQFMIREAERWMESMDVVVATWICS